MGFSNEPTPTQSFAPGPARLSIEEIKARVTVYDLWAKFGYSGDPRRGSLPSPFRDDRTPSFSVTNEGMTWKDFGTAGGGDVIDFWMAATGCEKVEAIRDLRNFCGDPGIVCRPARVVAAKPVVPEGPEPWSERMKMIVIDATGRLDGNIGGVTRELMKRKEWNYSTILDLAHSSHIGTFGEHDVFVTREGKKIPLKGRLMYAYPHGIKCRPLPDTSHKDFWVWGKALYNVWRGDRLDMDFAPVQSVVIFEGETDLISAMSLRDEKSAEAYISIPGAAWRPSPQMCHLIGAHRKVILAFDDDKAGHEATARISAELLKHASHCTVKVFPWAEIQGFGGDIGDLCQKNPQGLLNILDKLLV